MLGYELLCKLVSLIFLAPASALVIRGLIAWSGNAAISNFDLVGFFLSPQGVLLVITVATFGFAITFFEIGGLALTGLLIQKGHRPSPILILRYFASRARDLWTLGFHQFVVIGGIALAVLIVALMAKQVFLGEGDIYFYVRTTPPEYWTAIGIAVLAAGVATWFILGFLVRWILAVPLLLVEKRTPAEALRESSRLVRELGLKNLIKSLAVWGLGILSLLLLGNLADRLLELLVFPLAGDRVSMVIALTALFQVGRFLCGLAAGFVISVTFSGLVIQWYLRARPEAGFPSELARPESKDDHIEPQQLRWQRLVFTSAIGLVLAAGGIGIGLLNRIDFGDEVAVTAHRGSSIVAPENTMAAILQAVEDGADYIEIDVQESADGVVVLIHDTDLRRLAGLQQNVWEVDWNEMQNTDVGSWFSEDFSEERIPSLEQVIEAVKGEAKLNIEIKLNGHDQNLEAEVVRLLRKADFIDQAIVMSLDYGAVRKVAELEERIPAGLTLSARVGNPTGFEVDFLAVGAGAVTRDLVARAHREGMEVHAWTVNEVDQMLTMIHLGVDNIITDRPDVLVALLEERSEMTNAEKMLLYLSDLHEGRL